MHDNFPDWYRAAKIEPNPDNILHRWTGVEEYRPDYDDVVSLTRLFFKLGTPTEKFLSEFRAPFKEADSIFPMKDNDQELLVLAGAELVDTMERSEQAIGDFTALAIMTASCQGLRPLPVVVEVLKIASQHLSKRAISRFSRKGVGESSSASFSKDLETFKVHGAPWDTLISILEKMDRRNVSLEKQLHLVSEESNILWWLFSDSSRDFERPFDSFTAAELILQSSKELADLTNVPPGPLAAEAFLDRVIHAAKGKIPAEVTIKDAINSLSIETRREIEGRLFDSHVQTLTPVMFGISCSIANPEEWQTSYKPIVGVGVESKTPPHKLAYQFYLEILFARMWKENSTNA